MDEDFTFNCFPKFRVIAKIVRCVFGPTAMNVLK